MESLTVFAADEIDKEYLPWVIPGKVGFPAFEMFKNAAEEIAGYLDSVVLTDETEKSVKKDLADARKAVDRLDKERIRLKKEILGNYKEFEDQVNEIKGIISEAEDSLRQQVKARDEKRRAEKEKEIRELWQKRVTHYKFADYADFFEKWFDEKYTLKTAKLDKTEQDMAAWLEQTNKEFITAESMGAEYVAEYIITLDLAESITNVDTRKKMEKLAAEKTAAEKTADTQEETATFIVTGHKDIELVTRLFEENKINFRRI